MDKRKTKKMLPVTVICGFLGSGKTTLVNHLLSLKHKQRVAVIVNDMGEINVDAQLVSNGNHSIRKTKEKLVEMSNGCICCTLREDLMRQLSKLSKQGNYDYVLIESSGISEPLPIAQAFYFENEQIVKQQISLIKKARLDTMVTLIDASNFLNQIRSNESFSEVSLMQSNQPMDKIPLSQLLLDQVEFANVLILNKTDLVTSEQLTYIKELLKKLNPSAKIIESSFGKVNPPEIINTKMFDIDKAQTTQKWIEELQKPFHTSETEEYNIQSFVYKARRPFHPQKIKDFLDSHEVSDLWANVLRAKGFIWIAKKDTFKVEIQKAGTKLNYHAQAFWWISIPKSKWAEDPKEIEVLNQINYKEIQKEVDKDWLPPPIGDKRQEIVFIGQNLHKQALSKVLDECLLSEQEFSDYQTNGGCDIVDVFPKEWDDLEKYFAKKGLIREQDGEWEDEWSEEDIQIEDQ